MTFFQNTLLAIQDFFSNSLLPWMLTYGATATAIWLIGFLFTFGIWSLWVRKVSEQDWEEVKALKARLKENNNALSEKFIKANIFERLVLHIVLFILLAFLWPLFLGLYTFIITKNQIDSADKF